jgi:hypothetical protein
MGPISTTVKGNRRCPVCGLKFPLACSETRQATADSALPKSVLRILVTALSNVSTVGWVLLLPGALNLWLQSPVWSFVLALPVAATWFVLFPRRYHVLGQSAAR